MRVACGVAGVALVAAELFAGVAAAGDDKDACMDSYVEAQRLRKDGKLREAHDRLLVCAGATCPAFIRNDCAKWIGEVEHSLPSVVFAAKDERGQDVIDVRVYVDGRKVTDHLDGRPVSLDPGPHAIHYELEGRTTDQKVMLAEGETNRRIEADFTGRPGAAAGPGPEPAARRGIPTLTVVLGGVAVVGLASFIVFAASGKSNESCAPNCSPSAISTVRRDYAIADVSWIVGLVAAGGAAYFWWSQPKAPRATPVQGATLRLEVRPVIGGGMIGLGGSL